MSSSAKQRKKNLQLIYQTVSFTTALLTARIYLITIFPLTCNVKSTSRTFAVNDYFVRENKNAFFSWRSVFSHLCSVSVSDQRPSLSNKTKAQPVCLTKVCGSAGLTVANAKHSEVAYFCHVCFP